MAFLNRYPQGALRRALDKLDATWKRACVQATKAKQEPPAEPVVTVVREWTEWRCPTCGNNGDKWTCHSCQCRTEPLALCDLLVDGPTPVVNGWTLLAVVQPVPEAGGNIIRRVPGAPEDDLRHFHLAENSNRCDACNTSRKRNETFLVRHEDGRHLQVGRDCLQAFLGADPTTILARLGWVVVLERFPEDYVGGRYVEAIPMLEFVAQAACLVRLRGFVSAKQSREEGVLSTAALVRKCLLPTPFDRENYADLLREAVPTEEDVTVGQGALQWALNLPGTTEYERNLTLLARATTLPEKTGAFAAAMVSGYLKTLTQANRPPRNQELESFWVGAVGARIEVVAHVAHVSSSDTRWGFTYWHLFVTDDGAQLTWATRSHVPEGKRILLEGTVAEHATWKDKKRTKLRRVKWKEA